MQTLLASEEDNIETIVSEALSNLTIEASTLLEKQGISQSSQSYQWQVDMRYLGQSHEISVPLKYNEKEIFSITKESFESLHYDRYGYNMRGRTAEWVTARVVATADTKVQIKHQERPNQAGWPIDTRPVILAKNETILADVYRRERLAPTQQIEGAALIEQLDTTIWIPPGWIGEQNANGTLWIRRDTDD
jgi:N-methylhydantoinase A